MAPIFGKSIGGGSSILTTPIQVTGLKAVGQDGGVLLTCDPVTEASYPYLKDYWVVWKKVSDGPIQNPYDGQHMTFAAPPPGPTGQDLSALEIGSTLQMMENNQNTKFILVHKDYLTSGNVVLLREDIITMSIYGSTNVYAGSSVDNYCVNDYLLLLPENVRNQILEIDLPYSTNKYSQSTARRKAFIPSAAEVGIANMVGAISFDGTLWSYFTANATGNNKRIAYYNNNPTAWITRNVNKNENASNNTYYAVSNTGSFVGQQVITSSGVRPAFCLPSTMQVSAQPDSQGDYTLV